MKACLLLHGTSVSSLPTDICSKYDMSLGMAMTIKGYDGSCWYPTPQPQIILRVDVFQDKKHLSGELLNHEELIDKINSNHSHLKFWMHETGEEFAGTDNLNVFFFSYGSRGGFVPRQVWDERTLFVSRSAPYPAIYLLYCLGAKEIDVYGLDGYSKDGDSHFFEKGKSFYHFASNDSAANQEIMKGTEDDLFKLVERLNEIGVKVFNKNPNSLYRSIPIKK